MSQRLYYRHSGKFRLNAPTTMLSGGAAVALTLGAVYGLIDSINPFIYLNLLLLVAVGTAVGVVLAKLAHWTHTRQPAMVLSIGVVCGLLALYAAWAVWLTAVVRSPSFIWQPGVIGRLIPAVAQKGVWTLGSAAGTYSQEDMVNGPMLWAIWLAEAASIVGYATVMPWLKVRRAIYCESCQSWATGHQTVQRFERIMDPEALRQRVEAGDLAALAELRPVKADASEWSRFVLDWCETCRDLNMVSVKSVVLIANPKREWTESEEVIVDKLLIDRDERDQIVALDPAARG